MRGASQPHTIRSSSKPCCSHRGHPNAGMLLMLASCLIQPESKIKRERLVQTDLIDLRVVFPNPTIHLRVLVSGPRCFKGPSSLFELCPCWDSHISSNAITATICGAQRCAAENHARVCQRLVSIGPPSMAGYVFVRVCLGGPLLVGGRHGERRVS